MKIVYLAPFGIRPKGTLLARMLPLAAGLQRLGHSVTIVAPPYTNPEDSGRTEVVQGVKLVNVALPRGGKALGAPALTLRMYRAARAENPDLIHLFKPKGYGGLAAMLHLSLGRPVPLLLDTDDWEGKGGMNALHRYSRIESALFDFQERWLPPRCAGVTVASRALEEQVAAMGVPPERVLYLPNCVDDVPPADGAKARERLGIPPEAPVVLLYTRFFEFRQERLHRLFADLHRRVPGVRFLVVGKGRSGEEALLEAAAGREGFTGALVNAGWVEPDRLPELLAVGDVAIYPFDDTLVNQAKCPAKLTELLRSGVPVVADSVGQIREYIDPASGLLCIPGETADMAAKVAALLREPERRRKAGEAAREFILGRFKWPRYVASLEDFYRRVV